MLHGTSFSSQAIQQKKAFPSPASSIGEKTVVGHGRSTEISKKKCMMQASSNAHGAAR
jgi:hypothetical protein